MINQPILPWPDTRSKVKVARLEVTSAASDDKDCIAVNVDPNRLTPGVTASADPVLSMRSPAYAIWLGKRLSGQ